MLAISNKITYAQGTTAISNICWKIQQKGGSSSDSFLKESSYILEVEVVTGAHATSAFAFFVHY